MKPDERFYGITDDFRSPYARDRDRVIHSGSFRKLEYKTQVFLNQEGDFFRTRLTHSLEVAQIARTVAGALGLNEYLVEAVCLAHDLGHTTFGHAGQDALNRCMEDYGGFEHNFQSLRIVDELEEKADHADAARPLVPVANAPAHALDVAGGSIRTTASCRPCVTNGTAAVVPCCRFSRATTS